MTANRKLAAILAADVVGFSTMMQADEAGTMAALKRRRKEILEPLVGKHRGRVIKLVGDGVLIEFASAVAAVECAVELQQAMSAANAANDPNGDNDKNVLLRIGVNLGDVLVEGSDLYGDGVNVAARLEALAEPGTICISGKVREEVQGKIELRLEDRGEVELKNMPRPVHIFSIFPDNKSSKALRSYTPPSEKPSIAVLPFINMSGDPEQEYFSDGITEDIITDLSQVSALFVVARNIAFTLKGKSVEVVSAAKTLGVAYILEGSVRKAGNRIRITAQLIDGRTAGHIWAERYDRDFTDIFALQDEISKQVVAALRLRLLPDELKAITTRSTSNPQAYQYYLKARSMLHLGWGPSNSRSARELFVKATEIDPRFAKAFAGIADCDAFRWISGDLDISYDKMLSNSNKAVQLAPNLPEAHASKGLALYLTGHAEQAMSVFEHALELDPEQFSAQLFYGMVCRDTGHYEKAATHLAMAAELSPADPLAIAILGDVYKAQGRVEETASTYREAKARVDAVLTKTPDHASVISLGATILVELGDQAQAEQWADRALSLEPTGMGVQYNAACTYSVIGKPDAALDCLEYIASQKPRCSGLTLNMMTHDTQFDPLRKHQRYLDLVARLKRITQSMS